MWYSRVVLAIDTNSQFGSRYNCNLELDRCNGFQYTKTPTTAMGPVLWPKSRHINLTMWASIKYLRSHHFAIWLIRSWYSCSRSFTCHCPIGDSAQISWVLIENGSILPVICSYFAWIQWILVGYQIGMQEVPELLAVYNQGIENGMIWSEFIFLIGAKVVGTVKWNHSAVPTCPKSHSVMFSPGNNLVLITRTSHLADSAHDENLWLRSILDHRRVSQNRRSHYLGTG